MGWIGNEIIHGNELQDPKGQNLDLSFDAHPPNMDVNNKNSNQFSCQPGQIDVANSNSYYHAMPAKVKKNGFVA